MSYFLFLKNRAGEAAKLNVRTAPPARRFSQMFRDCLNDILKNRAEKVNLPSKRSSGFSIVGRPFQCGVIAAILCLFLSCLVEKSSAQSDSVATNGATDLNSAKVIAGDSATQTDNLAEEPATTAKSSANTPLGIMTGVYNEGQAALWDFNLIDHFRWFGQADRSRGYSPEQPIKFSHVTHVRNNRIECQFCHWSVAKSPFAAIPEVEVCYGCHKFVKGSTPAQQEEIKKVDQFYQSGKPIPWNKVHVTPDFLKFNHKRHISGGVGCHECHGQIPEMEKVERVSSMKMGWCLSCHRERGASIDCAVCHR